MMRLSCFLLLGTLLLSGLSNFGAAAHYGEQPLSRIAIEKATFALHASAYVFAFPTMLGLEGQNSEWITVEYSTPNSSDSDWIGVFSPANFSGSICQPENKMVSPPLLCTAPIKPKVIAISNTISFANPKAPLYPRLALGKCWNEEKSNYRGPLNGTIHIVVGGGGSSLADFTTQLPQWSIARDHDFGFGKLTAFNHSSLLFEYKKSRDGNVNDSFTISHDYRDILACTFDSCPRTTLAS
ncbi:putative inactive purple acid phosphatase 1 [Acorus calamus]|uniref:Inactive purple acid phosphatase 1 n=1 Tax=Acorus calamus TaxID=4465 RepID=A0AAV9CV20_ACOCL|nr:putative inactive purple acid phosphatase 1 [Acorus calamus]